MPADPKVVVLAPASAVVRAGGYRFKRTSDVVGALMLIVPLAIPMAVIALAIRCTSRGPALYWSDRVGRDNAIYPMPKFRTMRTGTPEVATHELGDSASYITPVGRVLRRTSLDELPQLWSILAGHMSFVGPRPALFNQDDLVAQRTEAGVHALVPGLTGWAQVNGRDEIGISAKVALDREYLARQCPAFDARILWRTLVQAIRGTGVSH